jgi:3-hydroxyisobutyrate dehydrogenase-like beta-hydroxyacid dehydrogenase
VEVRTQVTKVGGEAAVLEEYRPVLEAMGDKIFHLGPLGSGTRMKLIVNLVAATNLSALAESSRSENLTP